MPGTNTGVREGSLNQREPLLRNDDRIGGLNAVMRAMGQGGGGGTSTGYCGKVADGHLKYNDI